MRRIQYLSLTFQGRLGKKKFGMRQNRAAKEDVGGIHGKQRIFCLDYAIIKRNGQHTANRTRKQMRHGKGDSK